MDCVQNTYRIQKILLCRETNALSLDRIVERIVTSLINNNLTFSSTPILQPFLRPFTLPISPVLPVPCHTLPPSLSQRERERERATSIRNLWSSQHCRHTTTGLQSVLFRIHLIFTDEWAVWMMIFVNTVHKNFHTKPCVFTAPDAHSAGSYKLKLPRTFIPMKYTTNPTTTPTHQYVVVKCKHIYRV